MRLLSRLAIGSHIVEVVTGLTFKYEQIQTPHNQRRLVEKRFMLFIKFKVLEFDSNSHLITGVVVEVTANLVFVKGS